MTTATGDDGGGGGGGGGLLHYVSTRGGPRRYSFKEAVLAGWADDGGMLLPERLPRVSLQTLKRWRGLSYPQLVAEFLPLFITRDQDDAAPAPVVPVPVADIVQRSFATFASPEVVETTPLALPGSLTPDGAPRRIVLAELFHGPSLAFKDLGMQVLANLLEFYLQQDDETDAAASPMTFLVGTSGDTGPSALAAVAGKARMRLLVLYPQGRVSPAQEAQMLAHAGPGPDSASSNVAVVAVEGTSDDLDEPIAELFQDEAYRRAHRLGSLNSVNVVRLLVQVAHYFYLHLRLTQDDPAWEAIGAAEADNGKGDGGLPPSPPPPPRVSFVVPTGAAGHVTAGVIAALMGLPVAGLRMATNENDILHAMMMAPNGSGPTTTAGGGVLQKKGAVVPTNSPAMDIQAPYNIERILHLLANNDPEAPPIIDGPGIRRLMDTFYAGRPMVVPQPIMDKLRALGVASTAVARDDDHKSSSSTRAPPGAPPPSVLTAMREVHRANAGYLLDPHTAVGVAAAAVAPLPTSASGATPVPVVCMGCAHPAKFAETVRAALGLPDEAAAAAAIRAWAAYPAAGRTLDLVARLKEEEGAGTGTTGGCPVFRWADRARWRALLEAEIERLEAADVA